MKKTKKEIFSGHVISLGVEEHELPDGRKADFEVVRHPGGSAVLPVLPDGRILLLRQFRPAAGGFLLEIPAGRLEPDEAPEECARRELEEETGWRPGKLEKLGEMLSAVGFCDERVHLFLATGLSPSVQALEADEFIEVIEVGFDEVLEMIGRGEIRDGKTQLALLLYRGRIEDSGRIE